MFLNLEQKRNSAACCMVHTNAFHKKSTEINWIGASRRVHKSNIYSLQILFEWFFCFSFFCSLYIDIYISFWCCCCPVNFIVVSGFLLFVHFSYFSLNAWSAWSLCCCCCCWSCSNIIFDVHFDSFCFGGFMQCWIWFDDVYSVQYNVYWLIADLCLSMVLHCLLLLWTSEIGWLVRHFSGCRRCRCMLSNAYFTHLVARKIVFGHVECESLIFYHTTINYMAYHHNTLFPYLDEMYAERCNKINAKKTSNSCSSSFISS